MPHEHASTLTVRDVAGERHPFGLYVFEIVSDGRVIARFRHDHRGDDYWVEFPDGTTERAPLGGDSLTFLQGGGPEPLRLTSAAVAYLTQRAQ